MTIFNTTNAAWQYVDTGHATWNADSLAWFIQELDTYLVAGTEIWNITHGGTGSNSGSITAPGALSFSAAINTDLTITTSGTGSFKVVGPLIATDTSFRALTGSSGGYSWDGDIDTVIYRYIENGMAFRVGGADAVIISPSGYLSVGGNAGVRPLHVEGVELAAGAYQIIAQGAQAGHGAGISFQSKLAVSSALTEMARVTGDAESTWSSADIATQRAGLRFYTNNEGTIAERLRIDYQGWLGHRTTSPVLPVHLQGTTYRIVQDADGKMGIGPAITSVAAPLSVQSTVAVDSVAIQTETANNALLARAGNSNFRSSIGFYSGGNSPFIALHAQHSSTANTLKNDGAGMYGFAVYHDNTNNVRHIWNSSNTADAEFTTIIEGLIEKRDGRIGVGIDPVAFMDVDQLLTAHPGIRVNMLTGTSAFAQEWNLNSVNKVYLQVIDGQRELHFQNDDLGNNVIGNVLYLGRNENVTNSASGTIHIIDKNGISRYLHVDAAGNLEVGTNQPFGTNDTANVVVGTQTSFAASKDILRKWDNPTPALETVLNTNVYDFMYKQNEAGVRQWNGEKMTGIVTDESPEFGMFKTGEYPGGKYLNNINVGGYLILSVQALEMRSKEREHKLSKKIADLSMEVRKLKEMSH